MNIVKLFENDHVKNTIVNIILIIKIEMFKMVFNRLFFSKLSNLESLQSHNLPLHNGGMKTISR